MSKNDELDVAKVEVTEVQVEELMRSLTPELANIFTWIADRDGELGEIEYGIDYVKSDPLLEMARYAFDTHPVTLAAHKKVFGLEIEDGDPVPDEKIEYEAMLDENIEGRLSSPLKERYDALNAKVEALSDRENGEIWPLLDDSNFVAELFSIMESSEYTKAVHDADIAMTPQRRELARRSAPATDHA